MAKRYRRLASQRGLLATGGSDFHGVPDGDHAAMLGRPCLPEPEFHLLSEAIRARQGSIRE
jgi:hypothetical protein